MLHYSNLGLELSCILVTSTAYSVCAHIVSEALSHIVCKT